MKNCPKCKASLLDDARFCSQCGSSVPFELKCTKCQYPNESNSKFCQECAFPLVEAAVPYNPVGTPQFSSSPSQVSAEVPLPPAEGITIEFPHSTSQSFDFAVAEARKFPTFQQFGDGKKALYRITIDSKDTS